MTVGDIATVITATCAGVGGIIGALALLVRAKGESARPTHLLRRAWDVVESHDLVKFFPATLAAEIREHILEDDE